MWVQAYEVLSDPQKRHIYNERGKEGVHMASAGGQVKTLTQHNPRCIASHETQAKAPPFFSFLHQVDIKMVFRLMFGGGAFDLVFGDVCELPMLKQMVRVFLPSHAPLPTSNRMFTRRIAGLPKL